MSEADSSYITGRQMCTILELEENERQVVDPSPPFFDLLFRQTEKNKTKLESWSGNTLSQIHTGFQFVAIKCSAFSELNKLNVT